jgi:hypothetical protein
MGQAIRATRKYRLQQGVFRNAVVPRKTAAAERASHRKWEAASLWLKRRS